MTRKDSGLSLVAVILGIVISFLVVTVAVYKIITIQTSVKENRRLVAAQMSDLGFQNLFEKLNNPYDIDTSLSFPVKKTYSDSGWYYIRIDKKNNDSIIVFDIFSVGGCNDDSVSQKKTIKVRKYLSEDGIEKWKIAE